MDIQGEKERKFYLRSMVFFSFTAGFSSGLLLCAILGAIAGKEKETPKIHRSKRARTERISGRKQKAL